MIRNFAITSILNPYSNCFTQGALYTLESCAEGYVSGGKDGVIKFWDTDFKPMATVDVGKSRDGYKGGVVSLYGY